jgi:hypothetical protein
MLVGVAIKFFKEELTHIVLTTIHFLLVEEQLGWRAVLFYSSSHHRIFPCKTKQISHLAFVYSCEYQISVLYPEFLDILTILRATELLLIFSLDKVNNAISILPRWEKQKPTCEGQRIKSLFISGDKLFTIEVWHKTIVCHNLSACLIQFMPVI